ncbi:CAP domain-containing protein [Actinoplanes xinjiangensis]|uniref:Uncharacterized protein YkwD n=1 Tax=Actinoplanes xinjiangensis TaxID=512350 RepID=A0A316ELE8_9ACTN|nr:CAP domain-containing protein [Actinoplanes xinjiangensis]PWK33302.1 uncharacterized protein YkwD [Actinoplanes xinjiangensis]GIF43459.1 hypothetical protein Axi01nite_77700 [Actinoplanes xinjiangensis]
MRLALRRLAVTALFAPVAAFGVTTMIASPAEAAPAESHPGGHWKPGPGNHGHWKGSGGRGPSWPTPGRYLPGQPFPGQPYPGQHFPGQPFPGQPYPGQPVGGQPFPGEPMPGQPLPAEPTTPAPATPAPDMPAPATPAPGDSTGQTLEGEINRLVNDQRTGNGCEVLTVNDQLATAARDHSAWMAETGTLSHTGKDGSTFVMRAQAAGYAQPSAENIAMGYRTAAEVVDGWMNSAGHRANILNCESTTVGVGIANTADGTPYYTQVFGR